VSDVDGGSEETKKGEITTDPVQEKWWNPHGDEQEAAGREKKIVSGSKVGTGTNVGEAQVRGGVFR